MIKYIVNTALLEALRRFRGQSESEIALAQGTRISLRWLFGWDMSIAVIRSNMPKWQIENTKLHEFTHHQQEKELGFTEYHRQYKEQTRLYGYIPNKFEVEARHAEVYNENSLINDM